MTFICPHCGYRDDPRWRNAYYDPHTSIMNWDDFQELYPVQSAIFKEGYKNAFADGYAYEREPRKFTLPIKYIKRGTLEEWKARGQTLHLKAHYLDPGSNKARQMKISNLHVMMRGKQ
jgi:hypothetical protein